MYEGYLHFAGTELANAARTQAYLDNIIPRFGFESCWDSESLPCIIGEAPYRTPALDPAPWFSESRPASAKFFGFYPLSVVGVEDSSREVTVTELVQDGAVFSLPRKASKEFRVQGVLMAEDGEGIDVGMSWLRGALEGTDCEDGGDCTGDTFCYMAYLPECCDYENTSLFPVVPVNERWTSGSNGSWVPYANGTIAGNTDGVAVRMPCPGDGAQYYAQGLIPGEDYRVTVEMSGTGRLSLGVGGGDSIAAKRHTTHRPDYANVWVLDFTAKSTVETIRVLSDQLQCSTFQTRIYGIKVERTAEPLSKFLPRFTSESFTEPASWVPVPTPSVSDPVKRAVSISGPNSIEALNLIWTNSTGATHAIPANAGGKRLMRGLSAGQRYIVYIKASTSNGVGLHFGVETYSDPTKFYPSKTTSLGDSWYTVEFTARTPQHYLHILTNDSASIVGNSSEQINVWYLRVDADPQTLYIAPVDQSRPAMRSLHNVTLLDGPNVIEQFHKEHGKMTSVEFTMAVGEPSIYGELTNVRPTTEATTFLIGNTKCQQGFPIRYNTFSNPRLAGAAAGSLPVLGIGQHTAVSSSASDVVVTAEANAYVSENAARITPNSTSSNSYMLVGVDETELIAGHSYTVSATLTMLKPQKGTLSTFARRIYVPNGGGSVTSEQGENTIGAQRVFVTFTYLGGTAQIRFYNGAPLKQAADPAGTNVVYWSNFLFEESGIPGSPFDGDTDGDKTEYTWLGTQHASTSKFAEDKPRLIVDPDCPPVPVAPQPPGIKPDCARDVDEWRRYWTAIPPELAGGWRESVPVITLSTSANPVKDVRVRFYANPLGTDLGEVDECGACGEFYLSYIPRSTVMVIDGILKKVTANVAGTGSANAMHLASDADYGPVRWPTMTCDVAYFMTVDISPDEVLDLDVRLAVAQRE